MIERPKKSVTRFFVPLIDVLILLFCIFLLMPFIGQPEKASDKADAGSPVEKAVPDPLPSDVQTLQRDLHLARQEVKELQQFRTHLADRLSVLVLYTDPANGRLFFYRDGERIDIPDQRTAEDVIDRHKRVSGSKQPFFLILPGNTAGYPTTSQLIEYRRWFKGVQCRIGSLT